MPDLKVKIGLIGKLDMLKFKNMKKVREQAIQAAPAREVKGDFPINNNAKALHPDYVSLIVDEIIDRGAANAKTYILRSKDGKALPYFRAGMYLNLKLELDGSLVTRSYSLCSSPKKALEGKYAITVRSNPGGFAADKLLAGLKVGDEVVSSCPQGFFYYEDLRDCPTVIGLAGGSGITPFLSMAEAIADGTEDFDLVLLVGSRDVDNILFKDELDALAKKTDKFKVVHVLSDSETEGYEHGFITAELIKKYAPEGEDYSVFLCGPEGMYKFLKPEIAKLGLPERLFRRKLIDVTKSVWESEGYHAECRDKTFELTVRQGDKEYKIPCSANEPVLVAIERAGIKAPSRCRSGECGWCRSKLVSGTYFVPAENEMRRWADKEYGYIHPCSTFATSDMVLEVPGVYY